MKGGCVDILYSQLQQLLTELNSYVHLLLAMLATDIRMRAPLRVCMWCTSMPLPNIPISMHPRIRVRMHGLAMQ